jgi:hypothetical protein
MSDEHVCADCGKPLVQRYPWPVRYELQWAHKTAEDAMSCSVRLRDAWPVPAVVRVGEKP